MLGLTYFSALYHPHVHCAVDLSYNIVPYLLNGALGAWCLVLGACNPIGRPIRVFSPPPDAAMDNEPGGGDGSGNGGRPKVALKRDLTLVQGMLNSIAAMRMMPRGASPVLIVVTDGVVSVSEPKTLTKVLMLFPLSPQAPTCNPSRKTRSRLASHGHRAHAGDHVHCRASTHEMWAFFLFLFYLKKSINNLWDPPPPLASGARGAQPPRDPVLLHPDRPGGPRLELQLRRGAGH